LSLTQVFALARAHRIAAVELRALEGQLDLPAYFAARGDSPTALAAEVAASGIRVVSLGTSLRLIDGTEEDRARFLEFVPWAEALGVARLRVFDGGTDAGADELERAAGAIRWWRALRAQRGWATDVMVETHDALTTSPAIGRLAAEVPGLAVLWDTHHTWKLGGEHPAETWAAIRAHVAHIHVKDSAPDLTPGTPTAYVLPGTGVYPMAALRAALADEYSGPLSLEWERQWHPELPPLELALRSAAERAWW
jgi:sugar phosphate isomerase/epimerase